MDSKTIVVDVPEGAGRVCITVWPESPDRPQGWEEVSVAPAGTSMWVPVEMTGPRGGAFEVQDHRGTTLRRWDIDTDEGDRCEHDYRRAEDAIERERRTA